MKECNGVGLAKLLTHAYLFVSSASKSDPKLEPMNGLWVWIVPMNGSLECLTKGSLDGDMHKRILARGISILNPHSRPGTDPCAKRNMDHPYQFTALHVNMANSGLQHNQVFRHSQPCQGPTQVEFHILQYPIPLKEPGTMKWLRFWTPNTGKFRGIRKIQSFEPVSKKSVSVHQHKSSPNGEF